MDEGLEIRALATEEIAPHIPLLIENGFTPKIDQGVWIGGFLGGELAGWVRVFDEHGVWMLEDVFVFEHFRGRGVATALLDRAVQDRDHLWLICDDEMIAFYSELGYLLRPKDDFPEPLATLYRAKGEWPAGADHNHNAMRWTRL